MSCDSEHLGLLQRQLAGARDLPEWDPDPDDYWPDWAPDGLDGWADADDAAFAALVARQCAMAEDQFGPDDPVSGGDADALFLTFPGDPVATHTTLEGAADALVSQLATIEAARARLDAEAVDTLAALHTVIGQQVSAAAARTPGYVRIGDPSVDALVVKEVALGTPIPEAELWRCLHLTGTTSRATGGHGGRGRHAGLRARLRAGTSTLGQAAAVDAATKDLPDELFAMVEDLVYRPMPDGTAPTHKQFTARLRRVVASLTSALDPDTAAKQRARALERRSCRGRLFEDGTGEITITHSAERIVAILERVETVARRLRATGDPRTLEQLRADIASGLLIHAVPGLGNPSHASHHSDCTDTGTHADTGAATPTSEPTTGPTSEPTSEAREACGCPADPYGFTHTGPAAHVWIVVPFEVATGQADTACEIPGHGWVTAAHARQIITAPGSHWRWLGVDHTGHALHLSTDRYHPTPAMVEIIRARDGICRGPNCTVPAHRCDLDHVRPYPTGPTSVTNLVAAHRGDHQPKTHGLWQSELCDDGSLTWTTLTGRRYTTTPRNWRDALHDTTNLPPSWRPPPEPPQQHRDTEPPPF